MSVFVVGGAGFIGIRLIPLLIARGEQVTCMDINPNAPVLTALGDKVKLLRGDVTQFDDVMAAMTAASPERVINLSYMLGSEHAPHVALKLNILGMDNCFEAARQYRERTHHRLPSHRHPKLLGSALNERLPAVVEEVAQASNGGEGC